MQVTSFPGQIFFGKNQPGRQGYVQDAKAARDIVMHKP